MIALDSLVDQIREAALAAGANSVKLIGSNQVFVANWVRLKCQYGCKSYGQHWTCPPYSPAPEKMREILLSYDHAVLVEFVGLTSKKEQGEKAKVMFDLERVAFLSRYHKAFALGFGPCALCGQECSVTSGEPCRQAKRARPSMEACGIDVFQTVRNAGSQLEVATKEDAPFKSFGLLLLD